MTIPLTTETPLPAPTTDAAELRAAWAAGVVPLVENLPARVMAPLLGVVWRSVFEPVPFITHLVGDRGTYKTSTARLACQFFTPDLHFHGLSGTNVGGTTLGLIRTLSMTNYRPVLIDDVTQDRLSQLISAEPTKATVITTGEAEATGSAQNRVLSIQLGPDSIANGSETFSALERSTARSARALLGASLIRWIADHRHALLEADSFDDEPNRGASSPTRWGTRIADHPQHGIRLMMMMLRTSGALTVDEVNTLYSWAEEGINEAISREGRQ